jgi:mannose-6-phosphate isomerase-like protein (cupin superfamily)
MPVYHSPAELKARKESWVEIDDFEWFFLSGADAVVADGTEPDPVLPDYYKAPQDMMKVSHSHAGARKIVPTHPQERIVVLSGEVMYEDERGHTILKRLGHMDIPKSGCIIRNALPGFSPRTTPDGRTFAMRAQCEVLHFSGHWPQSDWMGLFTFGPTRPCDYHYHDADEYWFCHRGHYTFDLDGKMNEITPGCLIAVGMGEVHGVPDAKEWYEGVGFGAKLEGQKRPGHLWVPVHGEPTFKRGRA